ncbi:MAG: hypothetical protein ACOC3W_04840 [Thermodesulfobacteriota bacterium]
MHIPVYSFSAIVGQERLKRALILNAVNPTIGGVLVRGEKGTATSAFLGYVRKKLLLLAGLAAATALLAVIAITQGAYDLTIPRVLQALVGAADGATKVVVWNIRMPRIIVGSGALPVGVVTSFMGAPMFLYLLIRGYK